MPRKQAESQTQPSPETPRPLRIKKYANRRFYDVTRSQHVTLADLHNLVRAGHELTVIDSRTGEDLTHGVLMQILLEREPVKLGFLPTGVLHEVIRTQQQFLGSVFEQFLRHTLEAQRANQQRWTSLMTNVFGNAAVKGPLDWTRSWMDAIQPTNAPHRDAGPSKDGTHELDELRKQVHELQRRLDQELNRKQRT